MSPDEAADLAARTLAAIAAEGDHWHPRHATDRDRVASDLAGLRWHDGCTGPSSAYRDRSCDDARRYLDGLRRTAALYGVVAP